MNSAETSNAATAQALADHSQQQHGLSWFNIVRLGFVQASLGSILVLMTSTMNRVMVVELGLAAVVPGLLFGIYYAIQIARPRLGYGSDVGGRRTPWILGGMLLLGIGAIGVAKSIAVTEVMRAEGLVLAAFSFLLVGIGVGAAGTSIMAMIAKTAAPERRGPAATILWTLMIAGFIVTTASVGNALEPYSHARLFWVTTTVVIVALVLTGLAMFRLERGSSVNRSEDKPDFRTALRTTWADPHARLFTIFILVSMIAYSAQDLILEPFAGLIFDMTPGETTKLTALQNQGALLGMIIAGVLSRFAGREDLRRLVVAGCLGSALALAGLFFAGDVGAVWPLKPNVMFLGFSNGFFAIAAITKMMALANDGATNQEGMRMGLWGGAQAIATGTGEIAGTFLVDAVRLTIGDGALPYMTVFAAEALLFVVAAFVALNIAVRRDTATASARATTA
ncbi:MAG: BCD family MFS transporter [Pseudomonadota bacterium]